MTHHSLDFYATLENLKLENRLKFSGNKVSGIVKEEEARSFMNKNELQYSQFMSNWSYPLYFIIETISILSWSKYWPSSEGLSLWLYCLRVILFGYLQTKNTVFSFFEGLKRMICRHLGAWKQSIRLWFNSHWNLHILYLLLHLLFFRKWDGIYVLTMKRSL